MMDWDERHERTLGEVRWLDVRGHPISKVPERFRFCRMYSFLGRDNCFRDFEYQRKSTRISVSESTDCEPEGL